MDDANASGTDFAVAIPRLTRLAPMIMGFLLLALRVTAGEVLILAITEGILTAIAVLLVQYSKRWLRFATALAESRYSDARITLFSVPEYSVKRPYRLPIGENPMGLPFYIDLTEGSTLVAGVTGFGKSNLLRTLVRSALESSCNDVRLIDLKGGLELSKFRALCCNDRLNSPKACQVPAAGTAARNSRTTLTYSSLCSRCTQWVPSANSTNSP